MKIGVFKLQGPLEGKTVVILDKYSFVDGQMHVNSTDALLMQRILCGHYGAELTFEDVAQEATAPKGDAVGSLAVQSTKLGQTLGEQINESATASALANAARIGEMPKAAVEIDEE